jgi:hypothetical protein
MLADGLIRTTFFEPVFLFVLGSRGRCAGVAQI